MSNNDRKRVKTNITLNRFIKESMSSEGAKRGYSSLSKFIEHIFNEYLRLKQLDNQYRLLEMKYQEQQHDIAAIVRAVEVMKKYDGAEH